MRILTAILKRALQLAILSLLVASATFWLAALIPGDFYSAQELDPAFHRQTLDRLRQADGLDQPLAVQYFRWLRRCLYLDFGESLFYRKPVHSLVLDAVSNTIWIGVPALALGLCGGVLLGTVHGIRRKKVLGFVLDLASSVVLALPTLVLGLAALFMAARTNWFPLGSMGTSALEEPGLVAWFLDRVYHLALPVACLTLPILAYVERIQCAATQEILDEPYLRAARARGLPRRQIFCQYLLRPSLNPILSTAGPLLGSVLSGSLILEYIFSWPGLGQVTYFALLNIDLTLVAGCVVGSTILLVAGNLTADILLLVLDPRARFGGGAL